MVLESWRGVGIIGGDHCGIVKTNLCRVWDYITLYIYHTCDEMWHCMQFKISHVI